MKIETQLFEPLKVHDVPKLEIVKESLEGSVSYQEALECLKTCQSPGSDGFTAEFLKGFFGVK